MNEGNHNWTIDAEAILPDQKKKTELKDSLNN